MQTFRDGSGGGGGQYALPGHSQMPGGSGRNRIVRGTALVAVLSLLAWATFALVSTSSSSSSLPYTENAPADKNPRPETNVTAGQAAEPTTPSLNTPAGNQSGAAGQHSVSVTVNGQPVAVPPSGQLHKNIPIEGGNVELNVSVGKDSDGDSGNSSSTTKVQMYSYNQSTGDDERQTSRSRVYIRSND